MISPTFSIRAAFAALALCAAATAQSQTTLEATAPGGKNTVQFDLNHSPNAIVSVTVNGVTAAVDSQGISGTKVTVKLTNTPANGDVVKVKVEYSGTEPKTQGVEWKST